MTNVQRIVVVVTCWSIAALSFFRTEPASQPIWGGSVFETPPQFFARESSLPYVVGRYVLPVGFAGLGVFFLVGWKRR